MKKIILIFTLFLSFVACSSDDDKNNSDQDQQELPLTVENLTGTWLSFEYRSNDGTGLGSFRSIPETSRVTFKFRPDYSVVVITTSETCLGNFQLNQENKEIKIIYTSCSANEADNRLISLTTNELILGSNAEMGEGSQTKFKKQK